MATIIAPTTAAVISADITVTENTIFSVFTDAGYVIGYADVERKIGNRYERTVRLEAGGNSKAVMAGTYRVVKYRSLTPTGVDQAPAIVVSAVAPSNADGRPDGTIYIQTV